MRMNQVSIEFFQETICLKKIKDGAYVRNLDAYAELFGNKNIKANIF